MASPGYRPALPTTARQNAKAQRELCGNCHEPRSKHDRPSFQTHDGSVFKAPPGGEVNCYVDPETGCRYRPSNRWTKGSALRAKRKVLKRADKAEGGHAGPGRADQLTEGTATEVKNKRVPGWIRKDLLQAQRLRQGRGSWSVLYVDPEDGTRVEVFPR